MWLDLFFEIHDFVETDPAQRLRRVVVRPGGAATDWSRSADATLVAQEVPA